MKLPSYALPVLFACVLLAAAPNLPDIFAQAGAQAVPPGPAVPGLEPSIAPALKPVPAVTPVPEAETPTAAVPSAAPAIAPPEDAGPAVFPAGPASPELQRTFFRIGYLAPASESPLSQKWYRSLKAALENDPAFSKALREAGIAGVALRPCNHPEDMLQRMLGEEFDLVFCPAMVYVQERVAQQNRGGAGRYRVMFGTLRKQDASDTRSSEQVRHRGVLFVRRGSALGQKPGEPRVEDVKRFLHSAALAVSGSYDAAGFFYVRKMLWEEFDRCEPGEFLFYGSPQETVKAVVSGLCDAGACEESVLREVIESIPAKADARDLVRVIKETKPLPTDPVAIHERYDPAARGSELGRAAYDALRAFYEASAEPGAPRLCPGRDSAYDRMEDDLKLTRKWGW